MGVGREGGRYHQTNMIIRPKPLRLLRGCRTREDYQNEYTLHTLTLSVTALACLSQFHFLAGRQVGCLSEI